MDTYKSTMLKKKIAKKCLMINLHQELCIGKFIALTDKTEIFCFHTCNKQLEKILKDLRLTPEARVKKRF